MTTPVFVVGKTPVKKGINISALGDMAFLFLVLILDVDLMFRCLFVSTHAHKKTIREIKWRVQDLQP